MSGAGDVVNIEGLDAMFTADLEVNANGVGSTVNFQMTATATAGGTVLVNARGDIQVATALTTAGGSVTLLANNDVNFTAAGSIETQVGAAPVVITGSSPV